MKHVWAALVAAAMILAVAPAGAYDRMETLPATPEANEASFWGPGCTKYDGYPGTPTWRAYADFEIIIAKTAGVNDVWYRVLEGDVLASSTGQDISHLIKCRSVEEPTPTPEEPTPTPTPEEPTPTPTPEEPTPTPTPPEEEPSPTPTPTSPPITPTPTTPTETPSPTPSPEPSPSPTPTVPFTVTPTPTESPSSTPTATPTPTTPETPSPSPTPTSPQPTPTPGECEEGDPEGDGEDCLAWSGYNEDTGRKLIIVGLGLIFVGLVAFLAKNSWERLTAGR